LQAPSNGVAVKVGLAALAAVTEFAGLDTLTLNKFEDHNLMLSGVGNTFDSIFCTIKTRIFVISIYLV
jgi:hypothetical protein